jgi:uracil-DNA glycosylase
LAHRTANLKSIERKIPSCTRCPELRAYCAEVGRTKRRAYARCDYWARPVPGFGDPKAKIIIVGLAPAAHGANRTGRMFTGDRSGDFLYAALHRAGLANQPTSAHRKDGLKLRGVFISAAIRCAPPANKPTRRQRDNCLPYLVDELRIMRPRAIIALGSIAWEATVEALRGGGVELPSPRPKFAHGAERGFGDVTLLGCYHVSQQNTFTGRLTPVMLDRVLQRAIALM